MKILPAIDLKEGKCVRLVQGRMDKETVYSVDPVEVAKRWEGAGAGLLHIVDLDGAVEGSPKNRVAIKTILDSMAGNIQVGGGIRDIETAGYYLEELSVERIILGTAAYNDPALLKTLCKKFPDRIAIGIDARDGMVAIKGWVEVTGQRAIDLAKSLEDLGVSCLIYTDIARDGMLTGPNIPEIEAMVAAVNMPVIASGGISTPEDVASIKATGVQGAIIGKALYTGDVELSEAIKIGTV